MKKKMFSLALAVALLAGATVPAMAVDGAETDPSFVDSPSITTDVESGNDAIEIVTNNVVTGGYIRSKGTIESRPLNEIDYPTIKITTLDMSSQANAAVDAANPGATHEQKAGMMTSSGLSYGQNASVNETADRYRNAETTGEFVDNYQLGFFDNLVALAEGNLKGYSAIQIADISANHLAIGAGGNVLLTFSTPGVKVGSRVMVARINSGSMEFISASAGNGTISFDVQPSKLGTFVLMTRAQ